MKECLESLVGLSRTECECYSGIEDSLKLSPYGLFLDELEGIDLKVIQAGLRCGEDLDTNFPILYENAANFFETDLQVAISESHKQKHTPFIGKIGERKYSAAISTSALVGIFLDTNTLEGASIIVKTARFYFTNTGNLSLKLYANDELIETFPIEITSAGETLYDFETPLDLPLTENGVKVDYYFVYEPGGLIPYNTKISCGCAGVELVRKNFLMAKGFKGASISSYSTDGNAYGISLDAIIGCSIDDIMCDFMADSVFARRAAMAIWYKLGVLAIEKLFSSREINFDTFSDREYLYGRKRKFVKNYENIILWLSENTTIANSLCFICNNAKKATMGKILI